MFISFLLSIEFKEGVGNVIFGWSCDNDIVTVEDYGC